MRQASEGSGAEFVTVAVRRGALPGSGESILDFIDPKRYTLLPNTAGCYTADEAIRTCYLAREAGLGEMVKLEVIGDSRTLFPDAQGLLEATKTLAREGFIVMPYTNDDPVMAKRLEEAGAACVMPLGAPIGSGLGLHLRALDRAVAFGAVARTLPVHLPSRPSRWMSQRVSCRPWNWTRTFQVPASCVASSARTGQAQVSTTTASDAHAA